jgi:predicted transcriptional regulator
MSRNPRFADRLRRELVRRQTREQASMERQAAMQLANIEEIVAAARRARDRQLLDVESQEVLARTQLANVFNAPVYGGV